MNRPLPVLTVLASLLTLHAATAQESVTLAPAAVGAKAAFVVKLTQEQAIDAGGQTFDASQVMTVEFTFEVTGEGDGGSRKTKVTFDRIHGNFDIPGQEPIEFDSSKKGEGEEGMQAGVAAIAGGTFTATIDADGKVTDLGGFADTAKKAREAAGDQAQFLESLVGDRGLARLVRGPIGPLPKDAVAVGAKWNREEDTGNSLPMQQKLGFALASVAADRAEIALAGTVDVKKGEGARGPMADAKIEDGKVEGKFTISRKDAMTQHSEQKATMTIVAMGGQMEMDLTITTVLDRAGAKPAAAAEAKDEKK